MDTDLRVPYGANLDQVRQTLTTARSIEGILADKPVEVIYWAFGPSARTIRVRWWVATCEDDVETVNLVNAALETALAAADIQLALDRVDMNVHTQ